VLCCAVLCLCVTGPNKYGGGARGSGMGGGLKGVTDVNSISDSDLKSLFMANYRKNKAGGGAASPPAAPAAAPAAEPHPSAGNGGGARRFCGECGTAQESDARFCASCGTKID
jgi:hypothetical protein